jgi:hypothetical protein
VSSQEPCVFLVPVDKFDLVSSSPTIVIVLLAEEGLDVDLVEELKDDEDLLVDFG